MAAGFFASGTGALFGSTTGFGAGFVSWTGSGVGAGATKETDSSSIMGLGAGFPWIYSGVGAGDELITGSDLYDSLPLIPSNSTVKIMVA